MTERLLRLGAAALGVVLGWLALRFLLPWCAPFLTAWVFAALLESAVGFLVRHRWRRSAASAVCTLLALVLLGWGLAALLGRLFAAIPALTAALPQLVDALSRRLLSLKSLIHEHMRRVPEPAAALLEGSLPALAEAAAALPAQLSRRALALVTRLAQGGPDTLLFLVTAGLGTYFISASFPTVNAFLLAQLPPALRLRLEELGRDLREGFGGMLRAQLILMAMTFFELLVGLLLLRVPDAGALAALTAVIDTLPVFGTGIVLVPWALGCLLLGESRRGFGLLLCWGIQSLVRGCAQAKLVGDQIGLDPLSSLLAVYVGWRVCGVWGMLLFPLLLMVLIRLNERGVLRLWRSVE